MAKTKQTDFDGGQMECDEDSLPVSPSNNAELEKLLAAPKTKPTGGDGVGDRPWVCVSTDGKLTIRQPRQGDQSRPQCPYCSTDSVAVLLSAYSSPRSGQTLTTRYKCPRQSCSFSVQKMRPGVPEQLKGGRGPAAAPFVERP